MSSPAAAELAELARRVAVAAGDLAAAGRRADADGGDFRGALGAATKSTLTDAVTRHDRAAERIIVDGLLAARPDDTVIGEEGTDRRGTSGIEWYLDPIDGTSNFIYGLPLWSTSVAAVDAEGAVAGAVYVPVTGEMFVATRGGGATRNGAPIAASGETDVSLALVATGFSYHADRRREQAAQVAALLPVVRDVRRMGSAAIDLVYCAAGFVDAYYERHLNRWDMAAGELIAREAGCRSGDFEGGPARPDELLVATPGIFDELRRRLSGGG